MIRRERGFTLVELLVVIIIIAVLAAIAIPKFQNSSQRAREVALQSQLQLTRDAIEKFYSDCDGWPITLADLASPTAPSKVLNPAGNQRTLNAGKYQGPYLLNVPTSPIPSGALIYIDNRSSAKPLGFVTHTSGIALDGTNYADW